MKHLIGLLVFAALWIPSAYLGLHNISVPAHIQEFTLAHMSVSAPDYGGDLTQNPTYIVRGKLTDAVYSFQASCGRPLSSAVGYNGGSATKQVTNYPIQEKMVEESSAGLAEAEAINDTLGGAQFENVYTPSVLYGQSLPSLVDQVTVQQQQLSDTCNHDISEARWQTFFACPLGWVVVLLGIAWLLSLAFDGGGGFTGTLTRDIFTGGWVLRIWEK